VIGTRPDDESDGDDGTISPGDDCIGCGCDWDIDCGEPPLDDAPIGDGGPGHEAREPTLDERGFDCGSCSTVDSSFDGIGPGAGPSALDIAAVGGRIWDARGDAGDGGCTGCAGIITVPAFAFGGPGGGGAGGAPTSPPANGETAMNSVPPRPFVFGSLRGLLPTLEG
jgi:hypothetical protein